MCKWSIRSQKGGPVNAVKDAKHKGEMHVHRQIALDRAGLPEGVRRLLDLAAAVPERQGARREAMRDPILALIGKATIATTASAGSMLGFIGETFLAFLKLLCGQARFRRVDLALLVQECGAQALPIVTLITLRHKACRRATRGMRLRQALRTIRWTILSWRPAVGSSSNRPKDMAWQGVWGAWKKGGTQDTSLLSAPVI